MGWPSVRELPLSDRTDRQRLDELPTSFRYANDRSPTRGPVVDDDYVVDVERLNLAALEYP